MSRLVVVSNRVALPGAGAPGGLAVALHAALERSGGVWFGWDGKVLEGEPEQPRMTVERGVTYATLPLSRRDYEDYYKGYANRVLWPLHHYQPEEVEYHQRYEEGYRRVNAYFAAKLLPLLQPDDLIWVHDYHLIPLAAQLRLAGVGNPVGFFLHIPFPPYDVYRMLPHHGLLANELLLYDLVGFQTRGDCTNFCETVREVTGQRGHRGVFHLDGHYCQARVFPIGIDLRTTQESARKARGSLLQRRLVRSLVGRNLILGIDRLDYTKGLDKRFRAYDDLLQRYPAFRGKVVYLQVAQPSRIDVPEYAHLKRHLSALSGEVNAHHAAFDWMPLRYLNRSYRHATVLGFLNAAQVGLVTPLRDGMNLVAKEFFAVQDETDPGVLVLSEFAGAADELDEALLVNPFDTEAVSDTLARALTMPVEERRERWRSAMDHLRRHDVNDWRNRYLRALRRIAGQKGGT